MEKQTLLTIEVNWHDITRKGLSLSVAAAPLLPLIALSCAHSTQDETSRLLRHVQTPRAQMRFDNGEAS